MTVDRDKLRTKVQFVRTTVAQLEEIRAHGAEELLSDRILQAAAVRNLQVAIEAVLDIASHVIARGRRRALAPTPLDNEGSPDGG